MSKILQMLRLKCDRLVGVETNYIELSVRESQAASWRRVWGPEPYTRQQEAATTAGVRGETVETSVSVENTLELMLTRKTAAGAALESTSPLRLRSADADTPADRPATHRFRFPGTGHYTLTYLLTASRSSDRGGGGGRSHRARSAIASVARRGVGGDARAANVLAPGEWGVAFYPEHNKPNRSDATALRSWARAFCRCHDGPQTAARAIGINNGVNDSARRPQVLRRLTDQLTDLYLAMQMESRIPPLSFVAFFCHGWRHGFQMGVSNCRNAAGQRDLAAIASLMALIVRPDVVVPMYACSTAGATNDANGGAQNFAGRLRDALVDAGATHCRVIGHTTAGRADISRDIRVFEGVKRGQAGVMVVPRRDPLYKVWADALLDEATVRAYLRGGASQRRTGRRLRRQEGGNQRFIDDPSFKWRYPFMSIAGIRNYLQHQQLDQTVGNPALASPSAA